MTKMNNRYYKLCDRWIIAYMWLLFPFVIINHLGLENDFKNWLFGFLTIPLASTAALLVGGFALYICCLLLTLLYNTCLFMIGKDEEIEWL